MYTLGINLSHDRSACLLGDEGQIIAIAQERLDRQKHSCPQDGLGRWFTTVPDDCINYCLNDFGISLNDIDAISFCNAVVIGNNTMRNLSVSDCILQMPFSPHTKFNIVNHHYAHALSTYIPSNFEDAAVLVVDKGGSISSHHQQHGEEIPLLERASIYSAKKNKVEIVLKIEDRLDSIFWNSNSLGGLYEMATTQVGNSPFDAGKTMGLASYGFQTFSDELRKHFELTDSGYQISPTIQTAGKYLFPNFYSRRFAPVNLDSSTPTQTHADIARAAQEAVEEIMVHLAKLAVKKTGAKKLCIAGGVGLNCVANSRILAEVDVDEVFVQPAATDDGTAIGAAYHAWMRFNEPVPRRKFWSIALGHDYSDQEVDDALTRQELEKSGYQEIKEATLKDVAQQIADGGVIGWFSGKSEFGPRALGHRSLLADPRPKHMRTFLNGCVKHREQYRPYGASILEERADDYFELNRQEPYMLFVCKARNDCAKKIPSAVHYDGTCRVQTVNADVAPDYHELISRFSEITGLPMVLNTSFNGKDEPIVETPSDAIRSAIMMRLDGLYINGRFFKQQRENLRFPAWEETTCLN